MIFGSAVELPAPRRSAEVFIHSSATPGVSALPGVARSRLGGTAGLGTNVIQQIQQHQQRYHKHRGMARVWGSCEENVRVPVWLSRSHGSAGDLENGALKHGGHPSPQRPSCSRKVGSVPRLMQFPWNACCGFDWEPVCTLSADIKEPCGDNRLNSNQLIQRKGGGKKVSALCEVRDCGVDKITQWLRAQKVCPSELHVCNMLKEQLHIRNYTGRQKQRNRCWAAVSTEFASMMMIAY